MLTECRTGQNGRRQRLPSSGFHVARTGLGTLYESDDAADHHTGTVMNSLFYGDGIRNSSRGKPRLLDLFCCAGGAGVGYARAGFEVIGVDIKAQPNYPLTFVQTDALALDPQFIASFDAVHASPPCQSYSDLAKRNANADSWPRLIEPVREILTRSGLPYVIENVDGAPLIDPIVLCGTMFPELRVLRHRLFEANFAIMPPPHKKHHKVHTFDKRKSHFGKTNEWKDFVQVTGGGNCTLAAAREAMGIDWMTKGEINESIPPAYTEFIGGELMRYLAFVQRRPPRARKSA
jgi:DNA (cytosine-5)-methyltransferase 1